MHFSEIHLHTAASPYSKLMKESVDILVALYLTITRPLPAHPAHDLQMKLMLLVGVVVRIFLIVETNLGTKNEWNNRQRSSLTCQEFIRFKASVTLLVPTNASNEQLNSERSDEISSYLTVDCVRVFVRKSSERLPTACLYLI